MRKKRCIFCGSLNTKKHGTRSKKRNTSFGKRGLCYQRWYCNDCKRAFKPNQDQPINFSMQIRACELYYDSEASYRAVSRQLGIAPYRIFKVINALGANCKSTVDMAADFSSLAGYYTVPDAIKLINAFEKFNFKWAKDVVSASNIDAI